MLSGPMAVLLPALLMNGPDLAADAFAARRSYAVMTASPAKTVSRRLALAGGAATAVSFIATREVNDADYGLFGVLPVGPYKRKLTAPLETIVPDQIWTLDQKFGILNVQVPLRMTIVRLSGDGGLLVYNPIAATRELLDIMRKLEAQYGPVRHVVLGSVAIEHKVYAGVFAQKFPSAKVWIQPGQYSFPADLPSVALGFPTGRTFTIPASAAEAPWAADLDQATLGPIISRDGCFGETALFHRQSGTLLVTDTVLRVSSRVPPIFDRDPAPLVYHAGTR